MVTWDSGKTWYLDSEANGLVPSRFWVAVAKNVKDPSEIVTLDPDTIHLLPKFIEDAKSLYGHNLIGWDVPNIERVFNTKIDRSKIFDTLVWSRLANSRRGYGEEGDPILRKSPHSIEAWGVRFGLPKPSIEQWEIYDPAMKERCLRDVCIGFLCLKKLLQETKAFSPESIKIEHDLAWLLQDMSQAGFWLDQRKAHDLYVTAKGYADAFQEEIRGAFPMRSVLVREIDPKVTKSGEFSRAQTRCLGPDYEGCVGGPFSLFTFNEFNIDSPVQRVERLVEAGWEPKNFTKPSKTHPEGQPQFTAEDVEEDPDLPPEAKLIGKYLLCRSRERLMSQYLDLVDANSYVHGTVMGIGTYTHRMSHSNPNLGNPPKVHEDAMGAPLRGMDGFFGYECRDVWGIDPKDVDEVLLGMDLTAIQQRGLAHYIGDPEYIDQSVNNPSIHAFHGTILGVDKKKAKTWFYAWIFGGGQKRLGGILGGTAKDGKDSLELFMTRVPGLKVLRETTIPKWASQGWMKALDGRRVPVPSQHLALASALQSFEKVTITHSCVRLKNWTDELRLGYQPRMIIHDELQGSCPEKYAVDIGMKFKDIVAEVGVEFNSKSPLTAAWKTGKAWSQTH